MSETFETNNYIKLGTALCYLIGAKEGELLGGKHILDNIDTVLELIRNLDFILTVNSSGFQELKDIKTGVSQSCKNNFLTVN